MKNKEEEQIDQERVKYIRDNRKESVTMALELLNEHPTLVRNDDNLYIFNGKHYDLIEEDGLTKMYNDFVMKYGIIDMWKLNKINEIIKFIYTFSKVKKVKINSQPNLLCLNNGILNIDTMEFFDHSSNFYFDTFINVDYDPQNTSCPVFTKFLEDIFSNDKETIGNIIRLGGYLLDYSYENMKKCNRMFIFDGQGATGKSTLLDTFALFFSEKQLTSLSLEELAANDMEKENILTSRFNISGEQKKQMLDAENLKRIISGEMVHIKRKHKKAIDIRLKMKIIAACNGMPKFNDTSSGIQRRLFLFKFKNQYKPNHEYKNIKDPEKRNIYLQDNSLFDKIEQEKPAILNLFLEGLKLLRANNFIFEESAEQNLALEEFKSDNNVAHEFLIAHYVIDEDSYIPVKEVYDEFRIWYRDNVNDHNFKFRSAEMGKRIKESFNVEVNGRKQYIDYRGEIQILTTYPIRKIKYDDTEQSSSSGELQSLREGGFPDAKEVSQTEIKF